jgi:16S rRNA (guanine527-N7)-methyltransferase
VTVAERNFLALQEVADVSRETYEDLVTFSELLIKWNRSINLVSPASIPELWQRHILDSAQLFPMFRGSAERVADIGTGGGFPGLVLAILFKHHAPKRHITVIESDKRKCAFLLTVSTALNLNTTITAKRIEDADPVNADVLTSRALAPLEQLLSYANRHLKPSGTALLLKGRTAETEIEEALASWSMDLKRRDSKTTDDAVVLDITNLRRR